MLIYAMLIASFLTTFSGNQPTQEGADVTFRNGIHLRLRTHQTARNPHSLFFPELVLRPPNVIHRLFADERNHLGFGYDLDATSSGQPGEIKIQLKPLNATVRSSLDEGKVERGLDAKSQLPTFDNPREIGPLRIGQTVSIEVFVDPVTGNKVTDAIEVLSSSDPETPQTETSRPLPSPKQDQIFHFADVRVWLNGSEVTGRHPLHSIAGRYPVLYIPGHGSFFLALGPVENLPFVQAGTVASSDMRFMVGTDVIECSSRIPILGSRESSQIWVWHQPNYRPDVPDFRSFVGPANPDNLQIAVADSMEVWRNMAAKSGSSF